jgi:hypothetical protein
MFLRKVFFLTLGVALLSGTAYAQDAPLHLQKKNAISVKLGWHLYEQSSVFDFWNLNENEFDGAVWAFAYERKICPHLGIEVSLGFSRSTEATAGSDLTITNFSISPTAKYYFPFGDTFVFYAGGGLDYYNTKYDHKYSSGTFTYRWGADRFHTLGFHGLGGVDWYLFKTPEKHGFYSAPVSLFLEYQYTLLEIDNADDRVIRARNAQLGESNPTHELDLGGSTVFFGIRWHY